MVSGNHIEATLKPGTWLTKLAFRNCHQGKCYYSNTSTDGIEDSDKTCLKGDIRLGEVKQKEKKNRYRPNLNPEPNG